MKTVTSKQVNKLGIAYSAYIFEVQVNNSVTVPTANRGTRELLSMCIELAQDHRAWPAAVRDAVNALEAGQLRPG